MFGVHRVVGQQAQVFEDIVAQELSLIDDHAEQAGMEVGRDVADRRI